MLYRSIGSLFFLVFDVFLQIARSHFLAINVAITVDGDSFRDAAAALRRRAMATE